MRIPTNLCVSLVILSASVSGAAVVPLSQTRGISASAYASDASGYDSDYESASAPDFGAFSDSVHVFAARGGAVASASANQTSEFDTDGFVAQGVANSNAGAGMMLDAESSSSSLFAYEFAITEPTEYVLSGYIEAFGDSYECFTTLTLIGPIGTVFNIEAGIGDTEEIYESSTLATGEYAFDLRAYSSALHLQGSTAGFSLEMVFGTPTAAADVTWSAVKGLYR